MCQLYWENASARVLHVTKSNNVLLLNLFRRLSGDLRSCFGNTPLISHSNNSFEHYCPNSSV